MGTDKDWNVREVPEKQLVSEFKNKEGYQAVTEPVFTTDVGYITLSIDDGPTVHTERILDILAQKRARAIFFLLGEHAAKHRDVVRKIAASGHVIGNHSYSHPFFTKISMQKAAEEIRRTSELIADITGSPPPYFRPPYGDFNESTLLLAGQSAMKVVMWSADPKDYSLNTGYSVLRAAEPTLASRKILLLHDLKEATIDALPGIIDSIRSKDLEVTAQYEH